MINIIVLKNGNLEMTAEVCCREAIKRLGNLQQSGNESVFVSEFLGSDNTSNEKEYTEVAPEDCGALTSATLISDGRNIYGDMDYQVNSFLETLAAGGKVIWTKG